MADVSSLLSTLLSGGADSTGQQMLANTEPMTGATVLARLRGAGGGAVGKLTGGTGALGKELNDVNGSKGGALAAGIYNGMNAAAGERAAQQAHALELMKLQWDHNFKLAELKNKIDTGNATQAETKRYHDILDKYYTGQNEKTSKDDNPDSYKSISQREAARHKAATTIGLFDKGLLYHARGVPAMAGEGIPTDEEKQAAQDELAKRRKDFADWDAAQPWSKKPTASVIKGEPKADPDTGDTTGDTTGNPDPNAATGAGTPADVPLPPERPLMMKVSPLVTTTPPADDAPRAVIGPDGKNYTWTKSGGLVPATDADVDTALPNAAPPPPGTDEIPAFGQ